MQNLSIHAQVKNYFTDKVYTYLSLELPYSMTEFEILSLFICFRWLSFTPVRIRIADDNLKKKSNKNDN